MRSAPLRAEQDSDTPCASAEYVMARISAGSGTHSPTSSLQRKVSRAGSQALTPPGHWLCLLCDVGTAPTHEPFCLIECAADWLYPENEQLRSVT